MKGRKTRSGKQGESFSEAYRVRLPRFVTDEEIGLGDVVTRATSAAGIRPCTGCGRRAAALNRWVTFSPWRGR